MNFLLQPPSFVEGIGKKRHQELKAAGITNIAQMFAAGARRVHALCPHASPRQVGGWS